MIFDHSAPTIGLDGVETPVCIFCLSPLPTRRSKSKEHLLASAWSKHLSVDDVDYSGHGFIIDADGARHDVARGERPQNAPFAHTVPVVCRECNNGWMSRLEDQVVPILWGLAQGSTPVLSAAALRLLCQWAAKTAVVIEWDDQGAKAWSTSLGRDVMYAALEDRYPRQFATFLFRVAPSTAVSVRKSIGTMTLSHPPTPCTGHIFRTCHLLIHQIAVVTIHTGDTLTWAQVSQALRDTGIRPIEAMGADATIDLTTVPVFSLEQAAGLSLEAVDKIIAARRLRSGSG